MAVSTEAYLAKQFKAAQALGEKETKSDAYFEIVGHEHIAILAKTFPRPTLSPQGVIESFLPNGIKMTRPQQLAVAQSKPITFYLTKDGAVEDVFKAINDAGGFFDAWVHLGEFDSPYASYKLRLCSFSEGEADQDTEAVSENSMLSGTLNYHYIGERSKK